MNNDQFLDEFEYHNDTPKRSSHYQGSEDDMYHNVPHRRPRREELEREISLSERNRPMNMCSNFFIDMKNKPEGMDYSWVQCFSQGEGPTTHNVETYMKGGWSAVKIVQHPEVSMLSASQSEELDELTSELKKEYNVERPVLSRSSRYIRNGGLLLMQKNSQANNMAINRINKQSQARANEFTPAVFNANESQPFGMKMSIQVG